MVKLSYHFIAPLYRMIFEHDPPCMSQEVMQTLLNITNWYASPGHTFIIVFGSYKPLYFLPRYVIDKLFMQEVSNHLTTGLSTGLHRRKKASWPTLSLQIGLYKIYTLKDVDSEAKDLKNFEFDTNISFHMIHTTYARTIMWRCITHGSMVHVIGQRKILGGIATTHIGLMNLSTWL